MTFAEIIAEVKRRGTKDQAGTQFDNAVKNIINTSLFRISREALWRQLRRKTYFSTKGSYTTGSGAGTFTNGSTTITVTGATFITDGIAIGRRIKLSGDGSYHIIRTITSETSLTIDTAYTGTTTSTGTYEILGQEEYNLPIQASHSTFLWHEAWGYPYKLFYVPDQAFYDSGAMNTNENIPVAYRMWGQDMVIEQLLASSTLSVSSSSASDTTVQVTIFGTVSGYPDYETVTVNGTSAVITTKTFSQVERVTKNGSTVGRVTVTGNSGNATVAVIPVGNSTEGIQYSKIQLWPLPNTAFNINVQYYKDPFRLVNDNDVHELGEAFDECLILLATAKIKAESNQQENVNFFQYYQDELKSLKKTNVDKIDWFPSLQRPWFRGNDSVVRNLMYKQVGNGGNYGPASY